MDLAISLPIFELLKLCELNKNIKFMKCNLDDMVYNAIWNENVGIESIVETYVHDLGTITCKLNLKINLCSWNLHRYIFSFWLFKLHLDDLVVDHLVAQLTLNHLKVNL
jgi:hypothetical protein